MLRFFWISGLATFLLTGCGNMPTPPAKVAVPYLSSAQYEYLDCSSLNKELDKLVRLDKEFSIAQENRVNASKGHALFYGWGTGDGMDTIELAKVRGERDAVRRAHDKRGCTVEVLEPLIPG